MTGIGLLGHWARHETREAFERSKARGDERSALAIIFYVDAGWDRLWPYADMPEWLKPAWWVEPAFTSRTEPKP